MIMATAIETSDPLSGTQTMNKEEQITLRQQTKTGWKTSWLTRSSIFVGMFATFLMWATWGGWNIFWHLLSGGAIYYTGDKVKSIGDKDLLWQWPAILKIVGVTILVLTLISSGLFKVAERTVVSIDTSLRGGGDSSGNEVVVDLRGNVTSRTVLMSLDDTLIIKIPMRSTGRCKARYETTRRWHTLTSVSDQLDAFTAKFENQNTTAIVKFEEGFKGALRQWGITTVEVQVELFNC